MNQRWLEKIASFRPVGEVIDPRRYEVAAIDDDTTAKAFVLSHHYAGTFPAARFRFGLYSSGLVGVAVFSVPCNDATLTNVFPCAAIEATELGRFVLLDSVPGNGETWFLARCFELLGRIGLAGVVSFSDDQPRSTSDGRTIFGGHIGTIYQAFNGVYLGRGTARTLKVLPDGTVLSDRAIQKLLRRERGFQYVADKLIGFGADQGVASDPVLARAEIARLVRPLRHPGNHKYAWGIDKRIRRHLSKAEPKRYPKWVAGRAA